MIDAGVNVTDLGNSSTSARASAYAFGASVIRTRGQGHEVVEITLTLMDRGFIPLLDTISLTANAKTMRSCVLQSLNMILSLLPCISYTTTQEPAVQRSIHHTPGGPFPLPAPPWSNNNFGLMKSSSNCLNQAV